MKIYVFLVSQYYPLYSAIGRCVANVVELLSKDNKDNIVIIISTKQYPHELDVEELCDNVIVMRTTPSKVLGKPQDLRVGFQMVKWEIGSNLQRILRVVKRISSKNCVNESGINRYYNAVVSIIEKWGEENVVLIPTCTPFELVVACAQVKRDYNKVTFIPYLFDEFSKNISLCYGKLLRSLKFRNNLEIEKKAFVEADKILHVPVWSSHIERHHSEIKDKFIEVEHPLLLEITKNGSSFSNNNVLVYAGIVDKRIRNPKSTLSLMKTWIKHDPSVQFVFYSYGNAQRYVEQYSHKFPNNIISKGRVDRCTVEEALSNASALISIGNKNTSQTPSKIFEYISFAKPVIHISLTNNDKCVHALKKYPLSVIVPHPNKEININELLQKVDAKTKMHLDMDKVFQLFYTATPQYTANLIKKISQGNGFSQILDGECNL